MFFYFIYGKINKKYVGEIGMKKVFLLLFLLLMNFGYSENLDNYESKRVFEKFINYLKTGDCEKYKNDKEMIKLLKKCDGNEDVLSYTKYLKNNKYEIIEVKEGKEKSELIVKATYNSFSNIPIEEVIGAYFLEAMDLSKTWNELKLEGDSDYNFEILDRLNNKFKNRIKVETKVIKIYMDKENDMWNIGNVEDLNREFIMTIYPLFSVFEKVGEIVSSSDEINF